MAKLSTCMIKAADITKDAFIKYLSQYSSVIKEISESKVAKDGQKTLQELDDYRYGEALKIFGSKEPQRPMKLEDVKQLVEWKLRHGKFRPTLMNLVSSNEPNFVTDTIKEALDVYRAKSDPQAALKILTKLKGIGPASASLLLTVHDPDNVIFFSDEAFWWVACEGKKDNIKYNAKEFQALQSETNALSERLGVSATDIEKVAYVLIKSPESVDTAKLPEPAGPSTSTPIPKTKKANSSAKRKAETKEEPAEDVDSKNPPLRRSKRNRT